MIDLEALEATLLDLRHEASHLGVPFAQTRRIEDLVAVLPVFERARDRRAK